MLLLEIFLVFLGILGWVLTIWAAEIIPLFPVFVQKLLISSMLLHYMQKSLIFAGYLGIVLLPLNLLTGNQRWWMSRVAVAMLFVYIHYAWRVYVLKM